LSKDFFDIVAIDGPVGVGKSSVAKKLAQSVGFQYLDTGAMYRSVVWKAFQEEADPEKWTKDFLINIATELKFEIVSSDSFLWDGQNISHAIREEKISNNVFRAADIVEVRHSLVKHQQQMGRSKPSVLEGRDITTVVFTKARWKFYLDASPYERAKRRWLQLKDRGIDSDLKNITQDLLERDHKDRNRPVGGLKISPDALVIDTTSMNELMVINLMSAHIKNRLK